MNFSYDPTDVYVGKNKQGVSYFFLFKFSDNSDHIQCFLRFMAEGRTLIQYEKIFSTYDLFLSGIVENLSYYTYDEYVDKLGVAFQ